MKRFSLLCLMTIFALGASAPAQAARRTRQAPKQAAGIPLQKEAIAKVAGVLSDKPAFFGRPIGDRATWDPLARGEAGRQAIRDAAGMLRSPMPEITDELYLTYSRTGNRTKCDRAMGQRRGRLTALTVAELLENKGRFIPELERTIRALCADKTWVGTAHDPSLTNFNKTLVTVDLMSSAMAWNLATVDNLLGDRLSGEVRQMMRREVRWRIFDPFQRMVEGKQSRSWLGSLHNWNSVCLAGVTGAALGLIESRQERAFVVAAAMQYSENFLKGFTRDGYCGEGTGYWTYGYGHYVLLSEIIRLATDNRIDLLARPAALAPALFGARFEVVNGIYPAFADTSPGSRPAPHIVAFLNRRYNLGLTVETNPTMGFGKGLLFDDMMYRFPVPPGPNQQQPAQTLDAGGPRSWFEDAKILICRPGTGATCRLGAAIIGNDNGVNHNHNDVGAYIAVVGDRIPIADPGGEVYTKRTFSARRYESNVLNSFGHNVPLVAGQMQQAGGKARAVTVRTDFSEKQDTLTFDIRSAYAVKELQTLLRTYVYSREGAGSLTVSDEVAFETPAAFETALITFGKWKQTGPATVRIEEGGEAVEVMIQAEGSDFEIVAQEIHEDLHGKGIPTRLAIRFRQPVKEGRISVRIRPAK